MPPEGIALDVFNLIKILRVDCTATMSHSCPATIEAGDEAIYSKFTIKGAMWNNPADHDEGTVPIVFTADADVSLPRFSSVDKGLTLLYNTFKGGFDTFRGNIGNGTIFIRTGKGIVIKGKIHGGPDDGQDIVGSGTWIEA
ncbi:unnamed protein product [Cyclocybe aegerita]|uniref:Uncharacterized protein n=1 Tax=Cyclocybe aegerita TaxID=1973307 RepID=A0A8S0XQ06_CYCAE|nr:unnamed protein product [Cyclocybe aegerita]